MRFSGKPSVQEIKQSRDQIHRSLEAYGLNRDTTVLLGGAAMACLDIRPAHDIDAMVSLDDFRAMDTAMATPSGLLLEPKPHSNRAWLTSSHNRKPRDVMPLDVTFPVMPPSDPEIANAKFLQVVSTLPLSEEGWRYLTLQHTLDAMESFHKRKNRKDIRELKKRFGS